jgi:hypothetical protein
LRPYLFGKNLDLGVQSYLLSYRHQPGVMAATSITSRLLRGSMTTAPSGRQTASVVSDDSGLASGPGALQGQVWLTLQTHHAQRLIRGRPAAADKPAIIGLFGFADRLRGIWQGARQDDPYADWWLVKIEEALVAAEQLIQGEQAKLDERLQALPALEVTVATSQRAYRTPLRFANPHAFRGAKLLAEYDELARGVLTARHIWVAGSQRRGAPARAVCGQDPRVVLSAARLSLRRN